jgi:hypothetical protein
MSIQSIQKFFGFMAPEGLMLYLLIYTTSQVLFGLSNYGNPKQFMQSYTDHPRESRNKCITL